MPGHVVLEIIGLFHSESDRKAHIGNLAVSRIIPNQHIDRFRILDRGMILHFI